MLTRRTPLEPGKPLARRTGLARGTTPLRPVSERKAGLGTVALLPSPRPARLRKDTGFSPSVKLQVRTRAGNGDPCTAACESCGVWLGLLGGVIQHRVARLMGGRKHKAPSWFHTAANAALQCGTPQTGCNGRAERREPGMRAMGFWLESSANALTEPVMLHGEQGGVLVWLAPDGSYAFKVPGEAA